MIDKFNNTNLKSITALVDQFGRVHTNLRISVTDRCNIRCFYCMPAENVVFRPRDELLSFEEIVRFVQVVATMGITKLRLTGGEPLVRTDLPLLIRQLSAISGIQDIALTTNGLLLAEHAAELKSAGLDRLNVSLDTLQESTFEKISRRRGIQKVLDGIFAAREAGFSKIRLNAVAIRGLTEADVVPLAQFSRDHNFELRFIEFMPLDAEQQWNENDVLSGPVIRTMLENHFCELLPAERTEPSQPAVDFCFADGRGRIGFINPVSQPFCEDCNRLRLTAEGQVRNCLFSTEEWDVRRLLRSRATDEEIRQLVRDSVSAKAQAHGIGSPEFQQPARAMYQIGG